MQRKLTAMLMGSFLAACSSAIAAPSWQAIIPFRKVEADPSKEYTLTQDHGPWLIMCRAFAGETAEQDAHALVLELRSQYKLKAYVHVQKYDFTKKEIGKGFDKYGAPKVMRPENGTRFDEYAVLVGDFADDEDPRVNDTLEAIKNAWPKCLDIKQGQGQSQRYWGVRLKTREKAGAKERGPMRMAFLTRNPLLPDEFFVPKGLDPVVREMNKNLKYSLLKNPSNYTVRIATFRGSIATTIRARDYEAAKSKQIEQSRLSKGEEDAQKLVEGLRKDGVEAYVFHDLNESIVTVGSFDSVGDPRPDGKIEINPAVHQTIEHYKADAKNFGVGTYGARKLHGVTLDVQPMPVAVPKDSIGSQYVKRRE
jgi:hypothetical protein